MAEQDPIEEIKKELVRIFEPLFFKVVYFLGLYSRQIRLEAYEDGKMMWGIIRFIKDNPEIFTDTNANSVLTQDVIDNLLNQFKK